MFCPQCGKQIDPNSRFCSFCGTAVNAPAASPYQQRSRLLRPRDGRMIAGVCAAFALQYGWDVAIVRIIAVLIALVSGIVLGVVAYLVVWIIVPDAPYSLPVKST